MDWKGSAGWISVLWSVSQCKCVEKDVFCYMIMGNKDYCMFIRIMVPYMHTLYPAWLGVWVCCGITACEEEKGAIRKGFLCRITFYSMINKMYIPTFSRSMSLYKITFLSFKGEENIIISKQVKMITVAIIRSAKKGKGDIFQNRKRYTIMHQSVWYPSVHHQGEHEQQNKLIK